MHRATASGTTHDITGSNFTILQASYRFCGGAATKLFAHFKDINFVFAGAVCIVHAGTSWYGKHHNQHTYTHTSRTHIAPQPQCRPNELQRIETIRSFDLNSCHYRFRAVGAAAATTISRFKCQM